MNKKTKHIVCESPRRWGACRTCCIRCCSNSRSRRWRGSWLWRLFQSGLWGWLGSRFRSRGGLRAWFGRSGAVEPRITQFFVTMIFHCRTRAPYYSGRRGLTPASLTCTPHCQRDGSCTKKKKKKVRCQEGKRQGSHSRGWGLDWCSMH
jgi:hypothetical protein